jgi:ATP-binding cassette subfamily B protein/subfamily B ATP-binding cassette protein MsbA
MYRQASRKSYRKYREEVRARPADTSYSPHGSAANKKQSEKPIERQRSLRVLLKEFWKLLKGHQTRIAFALGTLTISTLLSLLPPAATKVAIDYVLTNPPQPLPDLTPSFFRQLSPWYQLVSISSAVVGITLVQTLIHLTGRWQATLAVNQVQARLRRQVMEHLLRLPLYRVTQLKSGGATSILREDAGGIADLIFSMLYNPWQAIIQLLGSLVILIWVDWRLMAGAVLLLPAVYFSHRTWIRRIRPLYRDIRNQRQAIDGSTTETFSGIRVVRTFARTRAERNRYANSNHVLVRQQLFVWWVTRLIEIIWEVLIPLASTALLIYGGWQILQSQLTLGDLMMFLVYLAMLLGPIATIAGTAVQLQNNLAGLDRVLDLMDQTEEMPDRTGAIRVEREKVSAHLELRGVTFRYPETDREVLASVNLDIPAGAVVALVGRSGAGKTTLCNLVARFYDPSDGCVLLDGQDLRDIQLESYRNLLGIVEQDVFLFDGTIAENIGYGRRQASLEQIQEAAKLAAADGFIRELPQGYASIIGERGVKLSGGQRQRLAIARAILADPRILILDEATSNLDSENEKAIQESLKVLMKNRTSIVIAHRLSTIMHADLIVVLDGGRIVETGKHHELLGRSGLYRTMVELQTSSL